MMNLTSAALKVFLALEPCDMRKSFDGLHALASEQLQSTPPSPLSSSSPTSAATASTSSILTAPASGSRQNASKKAAPAGQPPCESGQRRIKLAPEALQLLIDGVALRGAAFKPWSDLQSLRLGGVEKELSGLQPRLFGSSSEKLDPAQLQLELDQLLLGKPVPPRDPDDETSAPEEGKSNAAKTLRNKADRFPKNLKILVESITIPEEVLANPGDWQEIGEEHHDELDVIKAEIFWRRSIRKKFVHKTDRTRHPSSRPPRFPPSPVPC
jgi:transposase